MTVTLRVFAFLVLAVSLPSQWRGVANIDPGQPADPHMVVAGNNHYALYKSRRSNTWASYIKVSHDGGRSWGQERSLPNMAWPDIAGSGSRIAIAWFLLGTGGGHGGGQSQPDRFFVEVSTDEGRTFTRTELGTRGMINAGAVPAIAIENNDIWVFWGEDSGMLLQHSVDGGKTWMPTPRPVTTRLRQEHFAAAGGVLHTIDLENKGSATNQVLVAWRSSDGGISWQRTQLNLPQANSQYRVHDPKFVVSGNRLTVQYQATLTRSTSELMLVTSSDLGMTWSVPSRMNDTVPLQTARVTGHALAADGDRLISVHTQGTPSGSTLDNLFSRHSPDGGKTWTPSLRINRVIARIGGPMRQPQVAISGQRAVATWLDRTVNFPTPTLVAASSRDSGATWTANGNLGIGATEETEPVILAADPSGGVGVLFYRSSNYQLYANGLHQPFVEVRGSFGAGRTASFEVSAAGAAEDGLLAVVVLSATGDGDVTGGLRLPSGRVLGIDADSLTIAGLTSGLTITLTAPLVGGRAATRPIKIPVGLNLGNIWAAAIVLGPTGLGSISDTVKAN